MTVIRKIGKHGRAIGAIAGKRMRKALGLPKGVGYCVPIPRDLLTSPAWLAMSSRCRKLIDSLMVEFADRGGEDNGNLIAPYDMLQERGLRRETILDAVFEAQALGLVEARRGQRSYGSRKSPSVYRLTWLGTPDGLTPTNEWKSIKDAEEAQIRLRNARRNLEKERMLKRNRRIKGFVGTDAVSAA